jgi:hypothetical protein
MNTKNEKQAIKFMRILFADIVISIENIYAQMLHVRSPNPLDHAAMQSKYFIIQQ